MDGVNKVMLFGAVGEDPKTTIFTAENQVTTFSLATNSSYKDKDGVKQTKTEWHRIELWNEKSKFAAAYVKKGTWAWIEGSIAYDKVEKEGKTSYFTKIKVADIKLYPKTSSSNTTNATTTATPEGTSATGNAAQAAQQVTAYASGSEVINAPSEDLPF